MEHRAISLVAQTSVDGFSASTQFKLLGLVYKNRDHGIYQIWKNLNEN